jgi:hypothetical protein
VRGWPDIQSDVSNRATPVPRSFRLGENAIKALFHNVLRRNQVDSEMLKF